MFPYVENIIMKVNMKKEIKFKSISYNEIGVDGLIHFEYKWDEETETLTEFIDGVKTQSWVKSEARDKITKILK